MPPFLIPLLVLSLSSAINASPHTHPTSFLISAARRDLFRRSRVALSVPSRRREACEVIRNATRVSFSMRLISGAYTGTGEYFASFLVGTPAQKFLLLLDTGSDLTWVKCLRSNDTATGGGRIFEPRKSTTFRPISCSSSLCKSTLPFSLTSCSTPSSPCLYDYGYSDGSKARGFFGTDSATVRLSSGHRAKLPGLVLGCTSSFAGESIRAADGVLGLGNSPTSFNALVGIFAYCLVDHLSPKNATGFVSFGFNPRSRPRQLNQAALVFDRQLNPFYAVQIEGLFLGGERLDVPADVWNVSAGGGAILDTGTSLTLLADPAYKTATAVLSQALVRYPRVDMKPFEFCYNWTAVAGGFEEAAVPRLAVHMAAHGGGGGEVRLEPPVKSYVVDVADGVKCIGFLPAAWPGVSTIGNIMQQNHYWEIDVGRRRVGFSPSSC